MSDFEGDFEGLKYNGHGQFGYDAKMKKYVGTWVDSFGPHVTHMVGKYDAKTKTLTYATKGVNPDGSPEFPELVMGRWPGRSASPRWRRAGPGPTRARRPHAAR